MGGLRDVIRQCKRRRCPPRGNPQGRHRSKSRLERKSSRHSSPRYAVHSFLIMRTDGVRPSGTPLAQALTDGLNAFEAESTDYDLATTPQLHYLVRCLNTVGTNSPYGTPTQEGYYEKLATAFKQLMQGKKKQSRLTVDCANGVGAPKLAELIKYLGDEHLEIKLVNTDIHNPQKLNFQVTPLSP